MIYQSQILTYFSQKKKKKIAIDLRTDSLENIAHRIYRKFRKMLAIRFNLVDPIATIDSDQEGYTHVPGTNLCASSPRILAISKGAPGFRTGFRRGSRIINARRCFSKTGRPTTVSRRDTPGNSGHRFHSNRPAPIGQALIDTGNYSFLIASFPPPCFPFR